MKFFVTDHEGQLSCACCNNAQNPAEFEYFNLPNSSMKQQTKRLFVSILLSLTHSEQYKSTKKCNLLQVS